MEDILQIANPKEAATTLDRVDGSENTRHKFLGRRIGFHLHQFAVEPVQILRAFDQEFMDQIVHCTALFSADSLEPVNTMAFLPVIPLCMETCFLENST